jgi:hypothetical protein
LSLTGDIPYHAAIDKAYWSFDDTLCLSRTAGCILDEGGIDKEANTCIRIGRESEVTTRGSGGRCMDIATCIYAFARSFYSVIEHI